jgi:hypothetical protein
LGAGVNDSVRVECRGPHPGKPTAVAEITTFSRNEFGWWNHDASRPRRLKKPRQLGGERKRWHLTLSQEPFGESLEPRNKLACPLCPKNLLLGASILDGRLNWSLDKLRDIGQSSVTLDALGAILGSAPPN